MKVCEHGVPFNKYCTKCGALENEANPIIRFAFQITEAQKERADRIFNQYGLRRAVFAKILDEVLDIVEEEGPAALGILLAGTVKPSDIIPTMHRAREVNK